MINLVYSGKDASKIKKDIQKILQDLSALFMVDSHGVTIRIHENRLSFNRQLNRKTPDWLVANASNNKEIDILSPDSMKNESSHKSSEFLQIIKHEISHLFVDEISKGSAVPKWLNEGLASYIAKQHKNNIKSVYIDDKFSKKLATPKGWNDNLNYKAYDISSYFVSYLIKKYTFKKILKLISSLNKNYDYISFKNIFYKIYLKDLEEVELLFIQYINK